MSLLPGRFCKTHSMMLLAIMVFSINSFGQGLPVCANALSDTDGDGFGWENSASCRVVANQRPDCVRYDSDPDGDGFGWENGQSCVASTPSAILACQQIDSDPDGDGFGWENGRSCRAQVFLEEKYPIRFPACSDPKYDADSDGFGWENSTTCSSHNVGDGGRSITDLVLVTGQSNALGAETAIYDPASFDQNLDSPVKRVYVYSKTGWSIASLRQIWDLNWYPRADISGDPANNFAFHFAKQVVARDPQRVVGFILVTAPGQPISHWDKGQAFDSIIQRKVTSALNALPHKQQVDAMLWHQGESDYYNTAYYGNKLRQLIANFRSEPWVKNNAPFVCGETYNSPVNQQLAALNFDSDPNTACATANGLQTIGDDLHFSANSLRILGSRYARKYLEIVGF